MKIAYHYDYKTLIYQGESQIHKVAGYDEYILPQFSTWVATTAFDEETEHAKFDVKNQKWLVELKPVEVTAYHKQTHESKVFDDASLVTDDYTLNVPKTRFDEWTNDEWLTNLQNQYQAQVQQVTDRRAYLYLDVDRLRNEGTSVLEIEGDEAKAEEYRLQANALYLKIRSENPWPTPPEA